MRVSLFVTALIASSLFGGVALADRPGDDSGGRTTRIQHVREVRMHQIREAREARPQQEAAQSRVRDPKINDHLRNRGDMVDRNGAKSSVTRAKAPAENAIKSQRDADKALKQLTAKQDAVRNCSPTDDSCTSSRAAHVATDKASRQQRSEVQQMVDKVRAQKLREKIMREMCEKHANTCAENL